MNDDYRILPLINGLRESARWNRSEWIEDPWLDSPLADDEDPPALEFWEADIDLAHEQALGYWQYLTLLLAVLDGDLPRARSLVQSQRQALRAAEAIELRRGSPRTVEKTPLMVAAELGHVEIAQALLPMSNIDGLALDDTTAETPLILAVLANLPDMAAVLAPYSNRAMEWSSSGPTPLLDTALTLAAGLGRLGCVKAIIESVDRAAGHPPAPQSAEHAIRCEALRCAAKHGQREVVEYLARFADPRNQSRHYGESALMLAVQNGHTEVFDILLPISDVDARNAHGDGALLIAIRQKHISMTRSLIAKTTDFSSANRDERTPLLEAVHQGNAELVALLAPPSCLRISEALCGSALQAAAWRGHADCAQVLVRESDPLHVRVNAGNVLWSACETGKAECVRLLLPYSELADRSVALMAAVRYGALNCVELLAPKSDLSEEYRESSNARYGKTVLRIAASRAVELPFHKERFQAILRTLAEFAQRERPDALNSEFTAAVRQNALRDAEILGELASDEAIVRALTLATEKKGSPKLHLMPLTLARFEKLVMLREVEAARLAAAPEVLPTRSSAPPRSRGIRL